MALINQLGMLGSSVYSKKLDKIKTNEMLKKTRKKKKNGDIKEIKRPGKGRKPRGRNPRRRSRG